MSGFSDTSRVYLDFAASTPLDEAALQAMLPYLREEFGNASALYLEGRQARDAINAARRKIAKAMDCRDPFDITFTSGGTESDNTAIRGIALAARAKMKKDCGCGHVICSAFEHHAVLDSVSALKGDGFEISHVYPRSDGVVYPDDLEQLMRPDTVLVSIMMANNEIGTIQPIKALAEVAHRHGAYLHTDAVGAIGKTELSVASLGVDAMSIGSHKVYGPKGVGLLYLSKKAPFVTLHHGGGQEKGRRSGTYDTASIVGFAEAVSANSSYEHMDRLDALMGIRDRLIEQALRIPGVRLVIDIPKGERGVNLASFVPLTVDSMESEDLVRKLDIAGFAISGGSACAAGSGKTSHVLSSIGVSPDRASGFIRITIGKHTTDSDVDSFADALSRIVNRKG